MREEGRGVPVTAVDESGAGADEDSGRGRAAAARPDDPGVDGLALPDPDDLESFTVTAFWGIYESVPARRVTSAVAPVPADPGRDHHADHGRRS